MADTLHECCPGGSDDIGEEAVACIAIGRADANFHELVMLEREVELGDDCGTRTAGADQYDGFERVPESAQMFQL